VTDLAVATFDLSKRYGRKTAVDGLRLEVPRGAVYGFLGRNGAGKTTTIQMLMGLLAPASGSAQVLGLDPLSDYVEVHRRVTYMPEEPALYEWMRISEILWFASRLWNTWDHALAGELLERFELSPRDHIRNLSRGMKGKVALTLALAPRPEVLLLDDPTSGLDALVRREFMEGIIGALSETGTTVLFSSHIIQDVERIADHIGIIEQGRLLVQAPLDELKQSMRRVTLTFEGSPPPIELEGILAREDISNECSLVLKGHDEGKLRALEALGAIEVTVQDVSLEDVFVAHVKPAKEAVS